MSDPSKLAAARCVVEYLKATRNPGRSVKRRIDALHDAALVAGLLNNETLNPHVVVKELVAFEQTQKRNAAQSSGADPL